MQFKLFDSKTNEELFEGETLDFETNIKYEKSTPVDINKNKNVNGSCSLDVGNLHMDEVLLNQLVNPVMDEEFSLKINGTKEICIQKKKHKKKRINKKWLKKYGYESITVPINLEIPRCKFNEEGIELLVSQNY